MSFGGFGGFGGFGSDTPSGGLSGTPGFGTQSGGRQSMGGGRMSFGGGAETGDRKARRRPLIPINVKVFTDAIKEHSGGEDIEVFGTAPRAVEIVGNAREVEHDGLAIQWTLDDFTGSLRCKMYLEESDTEGRNKADEILKNGKFAVHGQSYVRVIGAIRGGSNPYLSAQRVLPVENLNEIPCHIAAIAHAYIMNSADVAPSSADGKRLSFGGISQPTMETASTNPPSSMASPANENEASVGNTETERRDKLLEFIKAGSDTTDFGYSVADMTAKFQGVMGTAEIRKLLGEFSDDGLVYDAGDEDHYKCV
ncbi:replication factor A protein 2 [Perkinsus chesapeaki]|uniref:Replication factor A protein 2 n=1 Tax=Perkinsus chesapeaki TaxID=330153 RepID=A0A7J6LPY4_PERCH|nr:replication factor A protein 2 [Perkinsus chesapeaki]